MYTMKNLTCLIGVLLSEKIFNVTAQTANIHDFPWMKEQNKTETIRKREEVL